MVWILIFFSLSFGSRALAEGQLFFMEPYVGFSKMEVLDKQMQYKDISDNFIIGVRSGINFGKAFLIGADYHAGGPYQFGILLNRGSWTAKSLGVVLGADYKVIRFWYGYYFDSRIDDSFNSVAYTGTAQKLGFGLVLSQKLRVNLEIMTYTLDKQIIGSTTSNFSDYEAKETNAYLSVPVDF